MLDSVKLRLAVSLLTIMTFQQIEFHAATTRQKKKLANHEGLRQCHYHTEAHTYRDGSCTLIRSYNERRHTENEEYT